MDRLDEEMENNSNVAAAKRKVETELEQLRDSLEEVQQQLQLVEQEKSQKEKDIATMDAELEKVNDALAKANKEKTSLGDRLQVQYMQLRCYRPCLVGWCWNLPALDSRG